MNLSGLILIFGIDRKSDNGCSCIYLLVRMSACIASIQPSICL